MRTLGIIALCVAVLMGGAIAWWAGQTPTYDRSFRLAIEVEVDGVPRVGSSVIEARTTDYKSGLAETAGVRSHVSGEAVFLDLGNGRNVIATLGFHPNGSRDIIGLLDFRAFRVTNPRLQIEDLPNLSGRAPLEGDLIPMLVTFIDLNDPKTARVVGTGQFEEVFGLGVRFKRAWLEITKDAVTRELDKKLSWLPHPKYLSGNFACGPSEPHCMHGGHFYR